VRADAVEAVARAVLYEGYLLYPYTRSAAKNQVRWTFGGVYPPAWEPDASAMRTECLLRPRDGCRVTVRVRCLQLVRRISRDEPPWQEAAERTVVELVAGADELRSGPRRVEFSLLPGRAHEGGVEREWLAIAGRVTVAGAAVAAGAMRLTVEIRNTTPAPAGLDREAALLRSMVSTHTVLRATGGEFVSLADPPPELAAAAAGCANLGTWPVLAGAPGSCDAVLSSPIILEDHPRVAEESPGDLFDATEIDEILTLRVLTLTENEKAELRRTDERGRRLLERCESLTADQLLRLHGTLREVRTLEEGGG
jgi:hypothetical protein